MTTFILMLCLLTIVAGGQMIFRGLAPHAATVMIVTAFVVFLIVLMNAPPALTPN